MKTTHDLCAAAIDSELTHRPADDKSFVALIKGRERYVFIYSDTKEGKADLLRTFGRFASDPELSFTWYDAAMLSAKVRGLPTEIKKG